ncbi:hypothetical protein R2R70_14330 [Cobetia sp. SIMBA_158]|uniref:hypothetical protein n=1 Tax=Cobetia sp. SIMBA_158 TaxID=3081617 RepID=UPI0039808A54
MAGYDPYSCNSLQKPYYRLIEIAIRWCGLVAHEVEILEAVGGEAIPDVKLFPQWPCLRVNCLAIEDAINNDDLAYGRDGKAVTSGEHVAPYRRTVRHHDLKEWMLKYYPGQKPEFLFDEIERGVHHSINIDDYLALQSKIEATEARVEKAKEAWLAQKEEINKLKEENKKLSSLPTKENVHPRSRRSYLTVIEALAQESLKGDIPREPYSAANDLLLIMNKHGLNLKNETVANIISDINSIREDRETEKA